MNTRDLTEKVIGMAISVHRALGPGLLESAYEECLVIELEDAGLQFKRQLSLPVVYKQRRVDCVYRIDLLVEQRLIIEVKASTQLGPIHTAQMLTYLKISGCRLGLLINFNVPALRLGVRRVISSTRSPLAEYFRSAMDIADGEAT